MEHVQESLSLVRLCICCLFSLCYNCMISCCHPSRCGHPLHLFLSTIYMNLYVPLKAIRFSNANHNKSSRVLLWFLKTDAELAQIIPGKPPSINTYWRSSVHSSRSALWCPTRSHTWTSTFHPVYCPSAGCDCSP